MLAVMTRMTLTQVSTWFANARRRLKKEYRVRWLDDSDCDSDDMADDDVEDSHVDEDVQQQRPTVPFTTSREQSLYNEHELELSAGN